MKRLLQLLFFLLLIKPLLSLVLGVNVFGRQNLPRSGQVIIIANHNSHLDTLAILNLFSPLRIPSVHPVAAEDYFMKNAVLAWFAVNVLNIIPIPREHFTKANNPITRMGEVLSRGESLVIFPEGSRGEPEVMSDFKGGVAHLIQKFPQVPVVPIFLRGMGRSLPKGEFLLVPFFCDTIIGEPRHYAITRENRNSLLNQLQSDVYGLQEIIRAD